jgi:hypothetical protein
MISNTHLFLFRIASASAQAFLQQKTPRHSAGLPE